MELVSASISIGQWLGSYFATRVLDKIFTSKDDFIKELSATINQTIEEYASKYPESDKNGKFPFYKSQKIIDELLKYRIMSGDDSDLKELKEVLTQEVNIIPPTIEQIQIFYAIFMQKVQVNEKLKKLEIKESFQEEIFSISKVLRNANDRIDNLVSAYNGDLQVQWRDRLNTYIETLKMFKPQTALELLKKLESSFDCVKNKPDDELVALIKYQEGICMSLLGDETANISFINAYKKDKKNIKYKENATIAYYLIKDYSQAKNLTEELIIEDEYNPTAWALKVFLDPEPFAIIKQIPVYVRNNTRFQCMLFDHYVLLKDFDKIYQLQKEGIILTSDDASPIVIDVDSFNIGVFLVNIMIGDYFKEYNYVNFIVNQFPDNELLRKLKRQLQNITNKIKDSEIKDKYSRLLFCESLADYVITKDKSNLLAMRDSILKDEIQDINLIIICANLLQLEGYDTEAIDLLNTCKSFESEYLKSYIFLKNKNNEKYVASMKEMYNSTLDVSERIIDVYFNSIFSLKEFGCLGEFYPEIFFLNKTFYSPLAQELCKVIAMTLTNESIEDNEEKLAKLADHFFNDALIMLFIADVYYHGKDFSHAVEIYNKYLNKEKESIQLFHFINCLYNLNIETEQALSLLMYWRENFTFKPYLTRVEYNLSASMLNWQRCLDVLDYGLAQDSCFEDFSEFRIFVLYKLNDSNINIAMDEYLSSYHKNIKHVPAIAKVLVNIGRSEEALILLEEHHSDDNSSIQMLYTMAAVAYSQEYEGKYQRIMIEYEIAEIGNFVKYELNGCVKFIELKEGSDQKLLVLNLIGKRKDDIVELKRPMSNKTDEIRVLRIMDKYLFLHDKIFNKANDPFSGLPMEVIHFDTCDDKNIIDVFKELFGKEGDARDQYVKDIMEQYYSGKLSYSEVIMSACAKDYIDGYYHLIFAQKGILTIPKMVYDNYNICYDKPYIIDLSTLPMLYRLSDSHNVQYPKKFVISKYLVELIRNKLKELKSNPHSSMSIITTSTQVIRIDNAEEQHLNNIEYLTNLMAWIRNNCEEKVSFRTSEWSRKLAEESKTGDYHGNGQFIVDYILNTMLLREDLDATIITEDTIYVKMLHLPLENTMSVEVYTKSILPYDSPAFKEFVDLKYLEFDCPSFILIEEFEKKKRGELNSYTFMVDNYTPTSWRSFIDLIFHITLSWSEAEKIELKVIERAFMQYNPNEEIIVNIRKMIYLTAILKKLPLEQIQLILNEFLNFSTTD